MLVVEMRKNAEHSKSFRCLFLLFILQFKIVVKLIHIILGRLMYRKSECLLYLNIECIYIDRYLNI